MCFLDSAYSISMKPAEVCYDLLNKVGNQTSDLHTLIPQVSTVTSCTSVRAPGCGVPLASSDQIRSAVMQLIYANVLSAQMLHAH